MFLSESLQKSSMITANKLIRIIPLLVFAAGSFLFFSQIDVRLVYNQQQPVFFKGFEYFLGFLLYPGGICDYLSNYLTQFFFYKTPGAIVAALSIAVTTISVQILLSSIFKMRLGRTLAIVIAMFLLLLHGNYNYPLSVSISFDSAIIGAIMYGVIRSGNRQIRLFSFLLLALATYWICAGHFFVFALTCILMEILLRKSYWLALLQLSIAAAIPYSVATFFIISTLRNAYSHCLPFYYSFTPAFAPYALYGFFFAIIPAQKFLDSLAAIDRPSNAGYSGMKTSSAPIIPFIAECFIAVTAAGLPLLISFSPINKSCLEMDYYAESGQWTEVKNQLNVVMHRPNLQREIPLFTNRQMYPFYVNQALYRSGSLLDSMFCFSQPQPPVGMVVPNDVAEHCPYYASNLYFELGLMNVAKRWAYEAYATTKTPQVLYRLALACLCVNERQDARICLAMLQKCELFQDSARYLSHLLDCDSSLKGDVNLQKIISDMPDSDYVVHGFGLDPNVDIALLYRQKPGNAMALEYTVANFLQTYRIDSLPGYVQGFSRLHYARLPRHVQEALIFFEAANKKEIDLRGYVFDERILTGFKEFMEILANHNASFAAARDELRYKFGSTYWYYLYNAKPGQQQ